MLMQGFRLVHWSVWQMLLWQVAQANPETRGGNDESTTTEYTRLPDRWEGCTLPRVAPDTASSLSEFSTPVLLVNSTTAAWGHLFEAPLNVTELLHPVIQAEIEARLPIGVNQVGLIRRRTTIREYAERYLHNSSQVTERKGQKNTLNEKDGALLFDAMPESLAPRLEGLFEGLDDVLLSIGPEGAGLPFHNHAAAWQGPIRGKKLFAFLPPLGDDSATDWLPSGSLGQEALHRLILPSPLSLFTEHFSWLSRNAPEVAGKMQHCVLEPGDAVYIPCNWYHATLNLEHTIAVGGQTGKGAVKAHCPKDRFGASFNLFRQAQSMAGAPDVAAATLKTACERNTYQHECTTALAMLEIRRGNAGQAVDVVTAHANRLVEQCRRNLLHPKIASAILFRFANVLLRGPGVALRGAAKVVEMAAELDGGSLGENLPLRVLSATLALSTRPSEAVVSDANYLCDKLSQIAHMSADATTLHPWYTAGPLHDFDPITAEQQLRGIVKMATLALKGKGHSRADL